MAKDECRFLSGPELSQQIRQICEADKADCAVAFWGRDMRDALFPRWSAQTVRIVCDIAMQGTPRAALEQLDAPDNPNLHVRDGLHAKVFISEIGAVIGSANASANGVGKVSGLAGKLMEAGLFCPPNSKTYEAAQAFFQEQFDAGRQVSPADLKRAAISSREPHLPASDQMTLLERLREHPEAFSDISIAIADDDMDYDLAEALISRYNEEHASKLTIKNVFLQSEPGSVDNIRRTVLLLYKKTRSKSGNVWGYVDAVPYPNRKPEIVIGRRHWPTFKKQTGHSHLKDELSEKEWKIIGKLLKKDEWLFTADQFSAALLQLSAR